MKLLSLSVKLWRAGYRAQRGTWWLLCACLLCCCGMVLYAVLSPFMENRHSIYYTLSSLHTDVDLRGGYTREELTEVLAVLSKSNCVDYYLLESRLDEPTAGSLSSISTVVPTRQSLYAVQPHDTFSNSGDGSPLDGHSYINAQYDFVGSLTVALNNSFAVGEQHYIYKASIWGDDLFDMLVSNHDFEEYDHPVHRVIYGISPLASRDAVDRLNERLAELLPKARFAVTMDKTLQTNRWSGFRDESYYVLLAAACLLTYYLLFGYLLDRRLRDLTVARLVGCRRGQLLAVLTGESVLNMLAALLFEMTVFSFYRLLFAKELPRLLLLLWGDALPVIGGLLLLGAVLGLLAGWRWLRRSPLAMQKEAMG